MYVYSFIQISIIFLNFFIIIKIVILGFININFYMYLYIYFLINFFYQGILFL